MLIIYMDELNNVYLATGIILAILLIISEILGCSKCFAANSITQFFIVRFLCLQKFKKEPTEVKPEDPLPQQMQEMPS